MALGRVEMLLMDTPDRDPACISQGVPPLRILLAFLRLGVTGFGGPAMVAYIGEVVVARNRWVSDESFRDGVALCQSIPGATAMQTAAYAGLRAGGVVGAAAAYVGFGFPAFLLMVVFSAAYEQIQAFPVVVSVFDGLRVIVVAIVANATLSFGRISLKNRLDMALALFAAVFFGFGVTPIAVIALAALAALLLYRGTDIGCDGKSVTSHTLSAKTGNIRNALITLTTAVAAIMILLFVVDRTLFGLGAIMLKVDLFAFGGGFASVPLMFHEVVEARGWLNNRTFMDGIALGQVTPGPIVITATFVGYQIGGLVGAIVGTLGIFTPSFIILLALAPHYDRLQWSLLFRRAVRGAVVCFVGLLLATTARFALAVPWDFKSAVIACLAFLALRLRTDIIWVVLAGSVISAIVL
jgi:chromate transporter